MSRPSVHYHTAPTEHVATEHINPGDDIYAKAHAATTDRISRKVVEMGEEELMLYEEAAHLGNGEAQAVLSKVYFTGNGRDRDVKQGLSLLRDSISGGSAMGNFMAGALYSIGLLDGFERDPLKASLHYTIAARAGLPHAKLAIAVRERYGIGMPAHCSRSLSTYHSMALQVVLAARTTDNPPYNHKIRRLGARNPEGMSAEEEVDAITLEQLRADSGDTYAQMYIGELYMYGERGYPVDYDRALQYFNEAAQRGDPDGIYNAGTMHAQGFGTPANMTKAHEMFQEAADRGSAAAYAGLAYMYVQGEVVERNHTAAIHYFNLAAEAGSIAARHNLGNMYNAPYDIDIERDVEKAMEYYQQNIPDGYYGSMFELAQLHLDGVGVGPQEDRCEVAVPLLKSVAEMGEWGLLLEEAEQLYNKGNVAGAAFLYDLGAEMGIQEGIFNAAYVHGENWNTWDQEGEEGGHAMRKVDLENMGAKMEIGEHILEVAHRYYWRGDYEAAAVLYEEANSQDIAEAAFSLGYMLEHGLGLEKNITRAMEMYSDQTALDPDSSLAGMLALWKLQYFPEKLNILGEANFFESNSTMHFTESARQTLGRDWPLFIIFLLSCVAVFCLAQLGLLA